MYKFPPIEQARGERGNKNKPPETIKKEKG